MNERAGFHAVLTALIFRREVSNDLDRAIVTAGHIATKILEQSQKVYPQSSDGDG